MGLFGPTVKPGAHIRFGGLLLRPSDAAVWGNQGYWEFRINGLGIGTFCVHDLKTKPEFGAHYYSAVVDEGFPSTPGNLSASSMIMTFEAQQFSMPSTYGGMATHWRGIYGIVVCWMNPGSRLPRLVRAIDKQGLF